MPTSPSHRSLPCLLIAQTQVAFNDNAAKLMLVGLAQSVLPIEQAAKVISLLATFLVLPFVFFAPFAGWLADRFPKQAVLYWALVFQIFVMMGIFLSVRAHSLVGAVVGFVLLAFQACIFSPAKQGILKELVGSKRLGIAVGWMEMLTIAAILLGSVAGGGLFDHWTRHSGDPWKGALWTALLLGFASVIALGVFQGVSRTTARSHEPFRLELLWQHVAQVAELWREKPLRLAALGVTYVYSFGGILYLTFVQLGRELHKGQVGSVTESGLLLALLGGGVGIGCLMAATFCRRNIELGLVPFGALGLLVALMLMGFSAAKSVVFYSGLMILGISSGLFIVPLMAFLQDQAPDAQRGRVIAGTNLLINLGGVLAVAIQYFLGQKWGLTAAQQFLVLILPSFAVAWYVVWLLPENLLRSLMVILARGIYRIRVIGGEYLPKNGALLICNHVSYVDTLILQAVCPRPLRFIAYEAFHRKWWIGWALRILGVIPISPHHAKDAVRSVAQRLRNGEWVCLFPEGELTRTGTLLGLRKGFELMARQGGAPVIPVFLDSLWGSIFSFSEHRYFWKLPHRLPYPVVVNFGKPIPADIVDAMNARQALLDLGEEAFQQRSELQGNLGYACLRALSHQPWRKLMVDRYPQRRSMSRGMILALAIALSIRWRQTIQNRRVGIVLPPGIGGTVANLALALAGKIPVNLNFTVGRSASESCLRCAKVESIISAEALRSRFTDFPWTKDTRDIHEEIRACGKVSILRWLIAIWFIPSKFLAKKLGAPKIGDREEAAVLFTSGSSGEPKGVELSHRNILSNVAQIAAIGIVQRDDILLACLPLFHSFGFTVTLWYPLLQGGRWVTVPSPLDVRKIAEAIHAEQATAFVGPPTFLRPYLRKADPEQLRSLRLVITGAEKLPRDLLQGFKEKFNVPIYEGYGLTETSPVASVNIPDPEITTSTAAPQAGNRPGSVGRLVPGMSARMVDPETGIEKSPFEMGMLYLRGPNIFNGYLDDPERTNRVLRDGWFITGDLARFDEDGFLYIEGRLARFSKIGGEMVPHGTVEEKIMAALGLEAAEIQLLMVTGIPDESKGEALVLLTTVDISINSLREKLTALKIPNLWIPKIIRRVEKIPVLASGKLDLEACEKLAKG